MIYYRDINCVPVFDIKMMHKSLVTKRFQSEAIGDIHEDSSDEIQGDLNESVDMFNDEGGANSRLASPGMEHLLEEQQEANKRIPKNVKFNRAFDIAKVTAEYMKDTGTEQFELYMKCFSKFSNMVRDGIPSNVINLLLEPEKFEVIEIDEQPDIVVADTDNNNRDKTVTTAKVKEFCEVPEQLKDYLGIDAVIEPIIGDGSCLYGSASAHIYQDQKHANELRRSCHKFMIDNWAYYNGFFPTPFTETVGVGFEARQVTFNTQSELIQFLLSDESLKLYNSSSVDLANMFGFRIAIFEHGNNIIPRWTWITPDQEISFFSSYRNQSLPDMWLYHEQNVHWDLLVSRPPLEKVSEEVGETLATSHNFTAVTATPLETVPEEVGETLAAVCEETADTVDSPLQFRHCPRGPGRPKTKRFGPPSLTSTKRKCNDDGDEEIESSQRPASKKQHVETTEKPKRGRPKGSKNKNPPATKSRAKVSKNKRGGKIANDSLDMIRKATAAAEFSLEEEGSLGVGGPPCFCSTTQWNCRVCGRKLCDFCTLPEEAEDGSARRCLECLDKLC